MRNAGVIAALAAVAATPAHAIQDFYVCRELTDGACTSYVAVLDGLASFEQLSVTGPSLSLAVGLGMGLVMFFLIIGLALGHLLRAVQTVFEGA